MFETVVTLDVPLRTDADGKIRVGETRVLLELVIHAYWQGETAEGIVDRYASLSVAEGYAVLAYYLTHREALDTYVRKADAAADRMQQEIEATYAPETLALRALMP